MPGRAPGRGARAGFHAIWLARGRADHRECGDGLARGRWAAELWRDALGWIGDPGHSRSEGAWAEGDALSFSADRCAGRQWAARSPWRGRAGGVPLAWAD